MKFSIYKGCGRATCQICDKKIASDEMQLNATHGSGAYTVSGNVHFSCVLEMHAKVWTATIDERGSKCPECEQYMLVAKGCTITTLVKPNEPQTYKRIKYGKESEDYGAEEGARCHDCGAKPNNYHHLGCDVERCPICGHQLISCDCWVRRNNGG